MKNSVNLFSILFLSACTAASHYTSPNEYQHKVLDSTDTVFVYTKTSSVVVEDAENEKSTVIWRYNKSQKEAFSIQVEHKNSTATISDTLSTIQLAMASEIQLKLAPQTVVAVFNDFGKTVIHFSGVSAVQSKNGSIQHFLARNHFKSVSESGSISVKLADVFDHTGFISSQSGPIRVFTGNLANALHLVREEYNPQIVRKRYTDLSFRSEKPPYIFVEGIQERVGIESAGTILW